MQVELLDHRRWQILVELAAAISGYVEIFHNRQHRLAALARRVRVSVSQVAAEACRSRFRLRCTCTGSRRSRSRSCTACLRP